MEAVYYAARANLRRLMILHPNWTRGQLAQATGMSKSWVDTWKKRLVSAPFDDEQVLHGLSRAPHHPLPRLDQEVVDRLLEIRDDPPEGLGRTPGPKALLYYLNRDETRKERKLRLPKSTRTVHRLGTGKRMHRFWPSHDKRAPRPSHADAGTSNLTLKTPPAFRLSHMAKSNTWSRRSISSIKAPRCWWLTMCAPILPQRRPWRRSPRRLQNRAYLPPLPWTGTHVGEEHPKAVTSLLPWYAIVTRSESRWCSVTRITPHKMGLWRDTIARSRELCLKLHRPKTLDEVRQATEAFATHYNWQRPLKANQLWQSASQGGLSHPALSSPHSRLDQPACLAQSRERPASGAPGQSPGLCESRFVSLLHLKQASWSAGDLIHPGQRAGFAGGLSTRISSLAAARMAYSNGHCPIRSISNSCSAKPPPNSVCWP
jgi:hypothetical protein